MKVRRLLFKLSIALGSLVCLFALAEIVARANEPGPFSFVDHEPYDHDPVVDHVHRPNFAGRWDGTWYEINSMGMRGPEWKPTFAANEFRVLALGDSATFGKGVLESECWPRQVETILRESAGAKLDLHVANAGVNGYSGRDYLETLRRLAPVIKPQLVLVAYNLNDFPNIVNEVDRKVFQGKDSLRSRVPAGVRDALGRLALFRWMRATYYAANRERDWAQAEALARDADGTNLGKAGRFDKEKERIKSIVEESQKVGAQVVFFLMPYESQVYLDVFDPTPIDRLRSTCEELGVTFIDVAQVFRSEARKTTPPKPLFLRGDRYHPSADGYRIVAETVTQLIKSRKWLPD